MTDLICDLPMDERPRERLLRHGAGTMSNTELIAILLGSGVRGKNALQLARMLLGEGLPKLARRDAQYFQAVCGIGPAKAARLAAAFEFALRVIRMNLTPEPEPTDYDDTILGTDLITKLASHTQERLGAVFLDSRRRILGQEEIFVGTIDQACVSPREILKRTLDQRATALVLYHNHPSGDPTPSHEDIQFTRAMKDVLKGIRTELLDHLVIGAHRYISMRALGVM